MTHQNHQTNGASLEDCHTNFFALTELYGIKWRKLVWGENGSGEEDGAALADPVISSYARCLAGDILCVWRRVPSQPQDIYDMSTPAPPPLSLRAAKELWIFWYGEEPDLNGLVAPELIASQGDQGSWESGLSYECRSLLFKALHNLIERCLLSRDFVRLGKWFVQPYDGDEEDVGKSPWHLSFSFAFFLHGESTVCASVDVRQHPPVRTVTARSLRRLASGQPRGNDTTANSKVILAPFGLEAVVTGRQWTDSDGPTARLLDGWRQLYPLEQGCQATEVVCGGVRLRYPLPYVLWCAEEGEGEASPPPRGRGAARELQRQALHHLTTPPPPLLTSGESVLEDFIDPTRKTLCTCAKWRRRKAARAPRPPPFHRRRRPELKPSQPLRLQPSGCAATACSPGSCGGGSPAASAPPSAGAPPVSPAPASHALQTHQATSLLQLPGACAPSSLHTPAPTPEPEHDPPPNTPKLSLAATATTAATNQLYNQSLSPGAAGATVSPRPLLPAAPPPLDPLEDEHELTMLYDYTTVHAWLEHPVKRFKSEQSAFREELALGSAGGDLYAGHDHTRMAAVDGNRIKRERQDAQEDVKEYKNLFTSDGLCPTFKDLDQIFDNSDDASGDETVRRQVSTPPESSLLGSGGRSVRAEELSKMFPTPPSLEAHAQPSPGFTLPDDCTSGLLQHHHSQHQLHATMGRQHVLSPPPDPIEDWSYVFKPPTVYKYVGSSKYAPLPTLPSQLLPPVALPTGALYRPRWERGDGESKKEEPRTNSVKRSGSPPPAPRVAPRTPLPLPRPSMQPAPPSPSRAPPACALLLNVLLADTVLNVFRDHNFDSCTLCVCNASPRVVGNILGADARTYLSSVCGDEEPVRCSCGFSAIVNRRRAHNTGLFYEDEMEITGAAVDPSGAGSGAGGLEEVAGGVLAACAAPPAPLLEALARAASRHALADSQRPATERKINLIEYSDGGQAAWLALRSACGARAPLPAPPPVSRWPFLSAGAPRSTRDVVRLMRRLRPLLQDAIQKRCHGARMWDSGVSGPLTWRQFHRLAGRGNEDLCEPQPVPPLLVGHERDWLSLAPHALRHWERLQLEPYAYARDIAYVALAPHCDDLTPPLKAFFRELSSSYEACRLGRHSALPLVGARDGLPRDGARDGLLRAGPGPRDHEPEHADDDWLGPLKGPMGRWLRAYAEALRTSLLPALANLGLERSLLRDRDRDRDRDRACQPPTPDPHTPAAPSSQSDDDGNTNNTSSSSTSCGVGVGGSGNSSWEEDEAGSPALVVYLVEPPLPPQLRPQALGLLLRLASAICRQLPHHNPLVKIISLEGVCESWGMGSSGALAPTVAPSGAPGCGPGLRALALSVFCSARRLLQHRADGKSLTGFGPAAHTNRVLRTKDEKNRAPYRLFSPAWVLAPPRALKEVAETWGQGSGSGGGVLFVSYCLSHDQRWLLAAASDARGELIDTAAINIHVPARSRRRVSAGARRLGLTKLMDFMLGVMSHAAQPWRLVVGRVGRIGHGELKGWSWLLSRKNLMRASTVLKEICGSCAVLYPATAARDPKAVVSLPVPCILSACLVSTEPDSCLRLMADRFTPDERFSQASIQSHLHTPRDVTATHILVFPTSATTQSNQMPFEQPMANGENDDMNSLFGMDMGDEDMGEDNIGDLFISDMFSGMWQGSPRGSPRRNDDDASRDGSPHRTAAQPASNGGGDHDQEQVGAVLQQPLALGYMVSTAPLAGMPAWWWAGSDHLQGACPAFLKNALHLHAGSVQSPDDYMSLTHRRDHNTHPLDSQTTTDVLRYVLEGYNALSWLALDGTTHDRASCLPLHVQVLMQLYHTAAALG